ncbi:MAG: hypothetical protein M5U05_14205 [Anaerolineales bacterium]|jgi:hypothetical protein|nr:hypothetical protein [Anaerolineales bacterium]
MAKTSSSTSDPQADHAQEMIAAAHETERSAFAPEPARQYERLAYISVIGVFMVLLACICSCTALAAVFLLNPPW